jgi:hypothetical protein
VPANHEYCGRWSRRNLPPPQIIIIVGEGGRGGEPDAARFSFYTCGISRLSCEGLKYGNKTDDKVQPNSGTKIKALPAA